MALHDTRVSSVISEMELMVQTHMWVKNDTITTKPILFTGEQAALILTLVQTGLDSFLLLSNEGAERQKQKNTKEKPSRTPERGAFLRPTTRGAMVILSACV